MPFLLLFCVPRCHRSDGCHNPDGVPSRARYYESRKIPKKARVIARVGGSIADQSQEHVFVVSCRRVRSAARDLRDNSDLSENAHALVCVCHLREKKTQPGDAQIFPTPRFFRLERRSADCGPSPTYVCIFGTVPSFPFAGYAQRHLAVAQTETGRETGLAGDGIR